MHYTVPCIASILETQHGFSYEIILVDNASTDFDRTQLPQDERLHLIESAENLGFSKGNNLGIQHARGSFILLLNNDTLVNANSILPVLEQFRKRSDIGAMTCQLRYPDGTIQHNCQPFPNFWKAWAEKTRLHKLFSSRFRSRWLQGFYFNYNEPGEPDWIWGTYFLFRKETLSQLPGNKLNDDYFMYMEDAQWCLDIRRIQLKIAYTPVSYIIHFGGGSNTGKRSEQLEKSMIRFQKNLKSKS